MSSNEQRRLLSAQARKSSTFSFVFAPGYAFLCIGRYSRCRNFEGDSFVNRSSVSHEKPCFREKQFEVKRNFPFHIAYGDFTADKALFVHTLPTKIAISLQQSKRRFIFLCSEEYLRPNQRQLKGY